MTKTKRYLACQPCDCLARFTMLQCQLVQALATCGPVRDKRYRSWINRFLSFTALLSHFTVLLSSFILVCLHVYSQSKSGLCPLTFTIFCSCFTSLIFNFNILFAHCLFWFLFYFVSLFSKLLYVPLGWTFGPIKFFKEN